MGHSHEDIAIRILLASTYGASLAVQSDKDGWIEKGRIGDLVSEEEIEANYDVARKAYYDLNPKEKDKVSIAIRHKSLSGLENNNGWNKVKQTLWESMNCDVITSPDYIEGFFPDMGDNGEIHIMEKTDIGYRAKDENLRRFFMGHMSHWREYNNNKPIY